MKPPIFLFLLIFFTVWWAMPASIVVLGFSLASPEERNVVLNPKKNT